MNVSEATNQRAWDDFLVAQRYTPFLQSWTMGEVYKDIGQQPVRLELRDGNDITGICYGHIVDAKRGKHLSIPYGPLLSEKYHVPRDTFRVMELILDEAKRRAIDEGCAFVRMSPFWIDTEQNQQLLTHYHARPSPLHLLAEHLWYLPLQQSDSWRGGARGSMVLEESLFAAMRATTRNLIRRAEKEGVTIQASLDSTRDLHHFLKLHDETRKRHHFTPYTDSFFRAQAERFAARKECTVYLAHYNNEIIAASIHMHMGGETSYHHGASTYAHRTIPASYLLQWTAIKDALRRGDRIYNFWGIAPPSGDGGNPKSEIRNPKHPFAGVTLFKTGFGGKLLNLVHCHDVALSKKYYLTMGIEHVRKWRRGF